jgi:hypothetical protein
MTADTFDDFVADYDARMAAAVAALDSRWAIRGFKGHETMNGYAYVFTLLDGRKPVAHVEEQGNGGAPMLYWEDRRGASALAFEAEGQRLFPGYWQDMMVDAILRKAGK